MEMTEMNLKDDTIPRIRMMLKSLTANEERVANYCIESGTDLINKSIYKIAEDNEVSTALIVKLSKRLGYKGFKDFKNAVSFSAQNTSNNNLLKIGRQDSPKLVIEKVFNEAMIGLKHTELVLDSDKLKEAAIKISDATKIDIYGLGGSGAVAMDLFHKLLRILIRSEVCTDSHIMAMSAVGLDSSSVVIGISHSGESKSVVDAMGIARQKNAYTISITNTLNSPISQVSDLCLCAVAESSPIVGENAAARIAMLTIIDVLHVLVVQQHYDTTIENLEKTIEIVKSQRVHNK